MKTYAYKKDTKRHFDAKENAEVVTSVMAGDVGPLSVCNSSTFKNVFWMCGCFSHTSSLKFSHFCRISCKKMYAVV